MTSALREVIQKKLEEIFDVDPADPDVQEVGWVVEKIARDLREGRIEAKDVEEFLFSQRTALRGLARRCSSKDPDEVIESLKTLIEEIASYGLRGTLGRMYEMYKLDHKLGRRRRREASESREGIL